MVRDDNERFLMSNDLHDRRIFMQRVAAMAALASASGVVGQAQAAEPLRLWASAIAKVGAKDFSAMEKQAGHALAG
jgi:hypothetical protein